MWVYVITAVVFLVLVLLAAKALYYIRAQEAVVMERGGRFHRCLSAGIHFGIPFYDRARAMHWRSVEIGLDGKQRMQDRSRKRIDQRETLFDLGEIQVATEDGVPFRVAASVSVAISDPQRAVYSKSHLPRSLTEVAAALVQQAAGGVSAAKMLTDLAATASAARTLVSEKLGKHGLRVADLQFRSAVPAEEVRAAIERKIAAEANKAAAILEAEAAAEAAMKEGQSKHQLEVMAAEAKRQAMALTAEAEANAIRTIAAAVDNPELARSALTIRYLDVLQQMASGSQSKIVFVPYEGGGFAGQGSLLRQVVTDQAGGS